MARTQPHPDHPDDRRTKITLAAITGLTAGTVRAFVGWLLDHFTGR